MIEGYKLKDWRRLPVEERATLFGENAWEYAERNLTDPAEKERFDQINRLTVDIYTGKLQPEQREAAQAEIDGLRNQMLENPDRDVGRVADLYSWIAALHFGNEIKNGIPTYQPHAPAVRSSTWYEVRRSASLKGRSFRLIPHEVRSNP